MYAATNERILWEKKSCVYHTVQATRRRSGWRGLQKSNTSKDIVEIPTRLVFQDLCQRDQRPQFVFDLTRRAKMPNDQINLFDKQGHEHEIIKGSWKLLFYNKCCDWWLVPCKMHVFLYLYYCIPESTGNTLLHHAKKSKNALAGPASLNCGSE